MEVTMAVHRFTPTHYHVAVGSHPAVLTVAPGDTVITTTVDARGMDAAEREVTERGNPQTGPFAVAGAEPGDMLSVRFDRITPNRRFGWSRTVIAPNVLDPEDVPLAPVAALSRWAVDVEARTATLVEPETRLGRLVLPLRPMVGSFGVAPPRGQAIAAATASTHGGNMDYIGFGEGATVHFPVSAPGGLFHLGDVHALQGDGEILGNGIEVSAEVEFTLRLSKGKTIRWPRAENETEIMTVGNARPLDQCVQHATTEMIRWLVEDYGLDARGAHLLLGQTVQYDIGNVFNAAYTVVCRMSKQVLADLERRSG